MEVDGQVDVTGVSLASGNELNGVLIQDSLGDGDSPASLTITEFIGLHIRDLTAGASSSGADYGIVLDDGADGIWFGGTSGSKIQGDSTGIGIGTSTPATELEVHGSATTTISAISEGAGQKGGRIILEDSDGAGCTEIYTLNGVITPAIVACPSN